MKIFYDRSVHENAAYYYDLAKKTKDKISGLEEAIKQTEKEIEDAKKPQKKEVHIKRTKQWFEKFHHIHTGSGLLAIGGRDAKQNDLLFSRHMEENDLFFHADIQGGSAVILKGGLEAPESDLKEVAQFAGCHSNAWKNGNAAVDVYAVKKDQVSKHAQGGFIPAGAFAITGQRKWFKGMKLALRIGKGKETVETVPDLSERHLEKELALKPSRTGKGKGALAKSLAKRFSVHPDELLSVLPNGKSRTIEAK